MTYSFVKWPISLRDWKSITQLQQRGFVVLRAKKPNTFNVYTRAEFALFIGGGK